MVQGGQRPKRPERGRQRITEAYSSSRGRLVLEARDVSDAACRLADRAETRLLAIRPSLPETRDPHHYQTRVRLRQLPVSHPPTLHRAGPEVFYQHVGLGYEVARKLLALFFSQVQGDGLFVAGDDRPPESPPLFAMPPPLPHRVALTRRLDLYDLRAKISQKLAAEWTRQQTAHLHNPHPVKGTDTLLLLSSQTTPRLKSRSRP